MNGRTAIDGTGALNRSADDSASPASTMGSFVYGCILCKRFIVVDKVRRDFEKLFIERMRAARVGDPLDEATEIGPLARRDLREAAATAQPNARPDTAASSSPRRAAR